MEWIRVKESSFPKDGSNFLSYREEFGDIGIVTWESTDFWEEGFLMDTHGNFYHPRFCTHWIPLPDAPNKQSS
jgi:hypothetical protein